MSNSPAEMCGVGVELAMEVGARASRNRRLAQRARQGARLQIALVLGVVDVPLEESECCT